ncbi:hypothetical protein OG394_16195 [Kribbella sp. NBC_01245]|uniref:hypothetical protein n=1 Tax=Kribbella sp. NBC_01245 TaxID=2903578 RepID=UPI002E2A4BD4|nr:hypothetical protein [Kribbella sp. NBC_01245]
MPYELQANSDADDLWVKPNFPGAPALGPFLNANGQELHKLVADGNLEQVDFTPRFARTNAGWRIGDLLWTTYFMKIASRRLIDVLEAIEATGYRSFPVEVVDTDGSSLGAFDGLAVLDADPSHDLYFSNGAQFWSFIASDRVVEALRAADVTGLSIKPAWQ